MDLVFNKVMDRNALESVLARNGAKVATKGDAVIVYKLSSGARGEVTTAGNGQFRLRVLAPPGCACMK